jgi:hypothetical protein
MDQKSHVKLVHLPSEAMRSLKQPPSKATFSMVELWEGGKEGKKEGIKM